MKIKRPKLLLKLFYLIFPFIVVMIYSEFRLHHIPNIFSVKRAYLENQLQNIKVLVLGNSQSANGVNPQYFSLEGYNLSGSSQSFYYDSKLTLRYIDRLINLKCVLSNVSFYSFVFQLDLSPENWKDDFYYRFWGIEGRNFKPNKLRETSFIALYGVRAVQRYLIRNFDTSDAFTLHENGWEDSFPTDIWKIDDTFGRKKVAEQVAQIHKETFADNYSYMENMLLQLYKHRVKLAFFAMPVLETYSKHIDPEILKVNAETIKKLCKNYGCKYYDYLNDKRFEVEDFWDSTHLSVKGAEKFSNILNKEVVANECVEK
jgi:hypothetical protein